MLSSLYISQHLLPTADFLGFLLQQTAARDNQGFECFPSEQGAALVTLAALVWREPRQWRRAKSKSDSPGLRRVAAVDRRPCWCRQYA